MIGQRELLNRIGQQISRKKFPRFSIIIGEKGSGKKELAKNIGQMMGVAISFIPDNKADTIRDIIEVAYKVDLPVLYVISDCDNMSSASANALLKITEEPPRNAYFIITCENEENLLQTIRSRGVTYMLEPYSYEDKCDYIESRPDGTVHFWDDKEEEFVLDVASNIGEIQQLLGMSISDFKKYVDLVIDNIAEVSDSNSFKIGDKIALKDEEDKYNLKLFWKAFGSVCVERMREHKDPLKYARAIGITGDFSQQLSIRGINKQMLFDNWVIAIREDWL